MGAVDKGIAKEAACRIEKLVETLPAGRGIRADARSAPAADAFADFEAGRAVRVDLLRLDRIDPREWRRIGLDHAANPSAPGPSTSISTPALSFSTKPDNPICRASAKAKGRNPTPCTTPRTRSRKRRIVRSPASASIMVTRFAMRHATFAAAARRAAEASSQA